MKKTALLLAALLASAAALHATELKFAAVFTDHAVLQRDVAVPVWGWADAGAEVKVEFAGQTKTAAADASGKWAVKLDPLKVSAEPQTLKVTATASKATVELKDILVGEVWLGSGQSNMALLVLAAKNFEQEKAAANLPLVRMFKEESTAATAPQTDGKGEWKVCSPETVGGFSATLFFFGREIHKTLGVPVGLINSSVGGTPIESWISPEAQHASEPLKPFFAALSDEKKKEESSAADAKPRYERALANWAAATKKAKAENKPAPRKPRDPVATAAKKGDVGGLFNGKIAPLIPYAIRGAIWYQGEANTKGFKAPFYQHQLPLLVTDWRTRWGYEFPFAWAQLPNFSGENDQPTVREAMLKTLALPKTGMGINIDIGEEKNIHPKNKQEVGRRLSLWALGTVYGQKVPATSGPLPAGSKVNGGEVELSFTHTDGGLVAKDGNLKGFVVAGADKAWKPATARIAGDKVIVSSAEVKSPVAVRYAWENWPTCNLYNGAGLPASPFRTDDWK
ncbi:MAG: sialate O-acetylesterase [Verrucomicrobia bacterium]|nr:sialate O-acetylesterase [Verrucomicrobiota bacterium]